MKITSIYLFKNEHVWCTVRQVGKVLHDASGPFHTRGHGAKKVDGIDGGREAHHGET